MQDYDDDFNGLEDIEKDFISSLDVPFIDIKIMKTIHEIRKETESSCADELKEYNLSMPQLDILATLLIHGQRTSTELSKRLKVTKANLTGMLSRLEEKKLVIRESSNDDGRVKIIKLTCKGRKKMKNVIPKYIVLMSEALSEVSVKEKKSLVSNLNLILQSLKEKISHKEE